MSLVFASTLVARLRTFFGGLENPSGEVQECVDQLFSKTAIYMFPELHYTAAKRNALLSEAAQTISISASHPLTERTIFEAIRPVQIQAIHYIQRVSSTLTTTNTLAWALQINKRTAGFNSTSATVSYSLTAFVAGITNCTTKGGSKSWSWSTITRNTNTLLPNPCLLSRTESKLQMERRDIITAKVRKGSKITADGGDDTGAIFRGGKIVIYYKER